MSGEDPGLLGNLPRSRPGTRSAKRGGASRPASAGRQPEGVREQPEDVVGDALRTAAKVAGGGLRAANDVTREVLRRLPRL